MICRQFGKPSGLLGRLAGWLMARNDADDRWIVELLDVKPDDRILEAGCGPGVALQLIGQRLETGSSAGVDHSEVMLLQAAARNKPAIRAGTLELKLGEAEHLPFPDVQFTKAFAIHSVYFWRSLERALREFLRVLQPDGRLILAVRAHRTDVPWLSPSRRGYTDEQLTILNQALESAGFADITVQRRDIGRETIVAMLARRP